jgi:hypothetical protein
VVRAATRAPHEIEDVARWRSWPAARNVCEHITNKEKAMNQLTTIDSLALINVQGGQAVDVSGGFKTPAGIEANGRVQTSGTPERKSAYTTCVNDTTDRGSGMFGGLFGASQDTQNNAAAICSGLKGSPTNPE